MLRARASLFTLLFLASSAWASAPFADLSLSASLDAPVSNVGWRGAPRAALGLEVPFIGPDVTPNFWFGLLPLIELHNTLGSQSKVPHELWRARFAFWAEWRETLAGTLQAFSLGVGFEHESDHATVRGSQPRYATDFLALNDAAVRGELRFRFPYVTLETSLTVQGYALTCTRLSGRCYALFGGSSSAGLSADVLLTGPRPFASVPLEPVLALNASGILGYGEVGPERRLVVNAGLVLRTPRQGIFHLVFTAMVGNDVGFYREQAASPFGLSLRWAR